jgi:hypothetical protein
MKNQAWNHVYKLTGIVVFTAFFGFFYYRSHDIIADFIIPTLHLFN